MLCKSESCSRMGFVYCKRFCRLKAVREQGSLLQ